MYHSFSYPFICWWTSRLLPCPGYYKQCCDEHWGTCDSFNSGFLGVYAQQWDCWVIRQLYFQFFKESPHCKVFLNLCSHLLESLSVPSLPMMSSHPLRAWSDPIALRSLSEDPFFKRSFIYLWLSWVFVALPGLSLVVASRGYSWCSAQALHCSDIPCCGAQALGHTGFSSCDTWVW